VHRQKPLPKESWILPLLLHCEAACGDLAEVIAIRCQKGAKHNQEWLIAHLSK
jgi:hypothetical protein